jgi:long-chain acyl-CoA synthetase
VSSPEVFELARSRAGEVALIDGSAQWTWGEVAERISRTAGALLDLGFTPGSRLGVLGTNSGETILTYAAAVLAGVGTILINYHSTPDEVEYILLDGGATALWSSDDSVATATVAAERRRVRILSDRSGWWTSQVEHAPASPPSLGLPATADLIYTSGTTGRPKAVEFPGDPALTVRDRLQSARQHHMFGLGPHLVAGPLYHAGPHAAVGLLLTGHLVVVRERFDPDQALGAIERHRIATSVMVPTHLIRLLGLPHDRRMRADVSSLRMVSLTGSFCPIQVKQSIIDWFGPVIREAYGASESGIISYITSDDWLRHLGSVGRAQPRFRPLVLDEDGSPLPPGQDGVMYFEDTTGRGIRYHNDAEKTVAAHRSPGVFTLGDVGHVDADGYIYISGRVTDMVISGGVNVYPAECERVLQEHPSVRDVVLFGIPDDEMGETLVGLVALNADGTTPEALLAYCRQSIAGYKVPKKLLAVPEVHRTPMGKLDKAAARQQFIALSRS